MFAAVLTRPSADSPAIPLAGDEYPAHVASYHGNTQLLSMLVHEGRCGVNDRDPGGSVPAHKGAPMQHTPSDLFFTLLPFLPPPCLPSPYIAASNGHTECLQWLIDHGADGTDAS